ncbi:hypothetical protein [Devosia aurantiaca]|uniref:Uncharacterized protein n=1 Tax=Devosia aurantiaca TaxID=2714858 RepID=A0A6M1SH64_9HYPH|nr:hypothetical protein [Devosia aurantiaca]NGP16520.1 hypothetical protein [Devosia aurantiaca]
MAFWALTVQSSSESMQPQRPQESFFTFLPRRFAEIESRLESLRREIQTLEAEHAVLLPHMESLRSSVDEECASNSAPESLGESVLAAASTSIAQSPERVNITVATDSAGPSAAIWQQVLTILDAAEEPMTTGEIIAAFATRFDRVVPRSSISPQLNRLLREKAVLKTEKGWMWLKPNPNAEKT